MTELEELREELAEFKALLLTPDQYVRYERLPQLVGGVTHSAGSEEVLAGDRWEYVDPSYGTPGSGYNFISPPAGAASVTVLNVTEVGKFLSLGILCGASDSGAWGGGEVVDADLRLTIDGGTPTNLPLASGGSAGWDAWAIAWRTNGDPVGTPAWGTVVGDTFALDLNFEFKTSLKIELVVNSATNLGGDTLTWFCYTHRARLVSP